jgi:formylmethanofuran dehydrogenase subunit B
VKSNKPIRPDDLPTGSVAYPDAVCTVCGCVCDDLAFHVQDGKLVHAERACALAKPWFERLIEVESNASQSPVLAKIHGEPATFDEAISRAAAILNASSAPLVYGLSRSSTPGQRAAVRLAEELGAIIDTTASVCHGPSIMAIQQTGESTSTLGEIRERADLVMFWGANPAVSHPRHFERYSVEPASFELPRGRADRTLIVIDSKPTETATLADVFLQVPSGKDFELIQSLRCVLCGHPLPEVSSGHMSKEEIESLAQRLQSCRYGVVFFGLGIAQQPLGHLTVDVLLRLVAELNDHTRFTARRLRIPGDVSGADSVLCWQTGYPFAVNLNRDYPRYNPGEYSAVDLLLRQEVDAAVIIGSESLDDFPAQAIEALERLPTIVLDYPHAECRFAPTVEFTTAVYGLHAKGTTYRMDEVPIPQRRYLPSPYPTDEAVLEQLRRRIHVSKS